jgi:hypothetical protein
MLHFIEFGYSQFFRQCESVTYVLTGLQSAEITISGRIACKQIFRINAQALKRCD